MANLNIQSSLPTPPVAASIPPNNSASDAQNGKTFGEVLKQQVRENTSNNPATAQSAPVADKKIKVEKDLNSNKTKDAIDPSTALVPADLSGNMIALLQPLQESRTSM